MRKSGNPRSQLCLALALFISAPAAQAVFSQDLILHETTTISGMMGSEDQTVTVTNYFSGSAIKRSTSDGNDTIMHLDQGRIITIDHEQKTYSEMTLEQLNAIFDKLSEAFDQNTEQMEAMRKVMGGDAAISVTKVGPGETIAGYRTEKYRVAGPMQMEIWVAPDLQVPELYYDAMKIRMPHNPMFDLGRIYDEMKKIKGMTLKSITTIKLIDITTTSVVTSVERSSIPASTFEIPQGYKSVAMQFP
jgi:hypothetical protein